MRVGIGFDIHRFAEGRRLVLGGVEFEGETGLLGHSDADVVTHAVIDALLGAAGLGDIGQHFPDSDPRWRDASSLDMLAAVLKMLGADGQRAVNIDVAVVAERPQLADRAREMRDRLAGAIGIDPRFISVKATTAEGLGSLGRAEGIAAWAVALIEPTAQPERP